jgi:[CysO sulfur-carrier protein]-S-L-cysteine hydrolase
LEVLRVGKIRRAAVDDVIAHAREEAPLECCGLLIGVPGLVEEALRTRNVRQSATTYLVNPADHFAAIRRARTERRTILGAYHSHPRTPAVPSPRDLREALYDDFLYVIVSLADPHAADLRGYRLDDGAFVPAPLETVP